MKATQLVVQIVVQHVALPMCVGLPLGVARPLPLTIRRPMTPLSSWLETAMDQSSLSRKRLTLVCLTG